MQPIYTDLQLFDSSGKHIGCISPISEENLSDEFCFKYWEWRETNSKFFLSHFENSPSRVKNWFLNDVIRDKSRKVYIVTDLIGTLIGVCGFKNLFVDEVELDTMMRGMSSGHPEIMISAQRALVWYLFSAAGVKVIVGKVLSKNILVRFFHKQFGFVEISRLPLARKRHDKSTELFVTQELDGLVEELIEIKLTEDSYRSSLKPYEWPAFR